MLMGHETVVASYAIAQYTEICLISADNRLTVQVTRLIS
jgi:hypothetical protein